MGVWWAMRDSKTPPDFLVRRRLTLALVLFSVIDDLMIRTRSANSVISGFGYQSDYSQTPVK